MIFYIIIYIFIIQEGMNEKYNISSGPYMENEFIFETVVKDKANNKIYNLKREIDILFVEQGKIRRWTFDH